MAMVQGNSTAVTANRYLAQLPSLKKKRAFEMATRGANCFDVSALWQLVRFWQLPEGCITSAEHGNRPVCCMFENMHSTALQNAQQRSPVTR